MAENLQCAFDGAELGSTDMKIEWSLPGGRVIGQQNLTQTITLHLQITP